MVPGRETPPPPPPPLRVVPKGSADHRFSCLSEIDSRSKGIGLKFLFDMSRIEILKN